MAKIQISPFSILSPQYARARNALVRRSCRKYSQRGIVSAEVDRYSLHFDQSLSFQVLLPKHKAFQKKRRTLRVINPL